MEKGYMLTGDAFTRVKRTVEHVERNVVTGLAPLERKVRLEGGGGSGGGGGDGPNSPCGPCGPRINASLVTLPDGTKAAQAYTTSGFNAVFGITGVTFEHLADGEYVADDIYFACPEDPPPEEEDPEE